MDAVHTAIWVTDIEATTQFYEDVLGLDFQRQFTHDGVLNYYVGTETGASIQFKHDPDDNSPVDPAGIDHLAFSVDDADTTFDRVVNESNCDVYLEPTTFDAANRRAAFVYDPDGYVVEFVQTV